MVRLRQGLQIDEPQLSRALTSSALTYPVGRGMAKFASLVTRETKQVAQERTTPRTRRHINSIQSRTVPSSRGVGVEVSSIHYGGAPEFRTRPHRIPKSGKGAKVLRFTVKSGAVLYRRSVWHPGTPAKYILRDGVKRAGQKIRQAAVG